MIEGERTSTPTGTVSVALALRASMGPLCAAVDACSQDLALTRPPMNDSERAGWEELLLWKLRADENTERVRAWRRYQENSGTQTARSSSLSARINRLSGQKQAASGRTKPAACSCRVEEAAGHIICV